MPGRLLMAMLASLLLFVAPAPTSITTAAPPAAFPLRVGHQLLWVEIAATREQRSRGLMFRSALDQDAGMLFVFPRPRQMSFWMRNTAIPLDIGFFDKAGRLREIHELQPFEEKPVVSRSDELRFALEVNRGWFSAHGVEPGARLDMEARADILAGRNAGG